MDSERKLGLEIKNVGIPNIYFSVNLIPLLILKNLVRCE